jgi:ATP-binding cassette subfamily B protein RaxB
MDEGTSHLDLALEAKVNAAVKALGLTRIIIAHRPETIASASRVLVVNQELVTEAPRATNQRTSLAEAAGPIERRAGGPLNCLP